MTPPERPWLPPGRPPWAPPPPRSPWWRGLGRRVTDTAALVLLVPSTPRQVEPPEGWPPAGGNWEGGTVRDGRRLYHEPWVGWRDDGPAQPHPLHREPATANRRARAGWWLHRRRHGVVAVTALAVVTGYASVVVAFCDRTVPTMRSGAVLVGASAVAVAALLGVVLWAHRD